MGVWIWEFAPTIKMTNRFPNTVIRYMVRKSPNMIGCSSGSLESSKRRNPEICVLLLGSMRWRWLSGKKEIMKIFTPTGIIHIAELLKFLFSSQEVGVNILFSDKFSLRENLNDCRCRTLNIRTRFLTNQSGTGWGTAAVEIFGVSYASSLDMFPLVFLTCNYMISLVETFLDIMDFFPLLIHCS